MNKALEMRIVFGLLFISLGRSRAFTSCWVDSQPKHFVSNEQHQRKDTHILSSLPKESDHYDNFYDDLDPSQFDGDNQEGDADNKFARQPKELAVPPFVQSEFSTSPVELDEIQALIDERAQARAERRVRKADEIRVALFRQYNVNINDKTLEWSVGSGCLGPKGHNYKLAADAGPNQSTLSEAEIHQMLSRRLQYNLVKDLRTASKIRKDLRNAGVKVSDKRREWRADGAFFDGFIALTYVQSELSKSTTDSDQIQALVDERAKARAEGLSAKADEIRVRLFREFQVNINDKSLEWSLGGTCFGPNGHDYELVADAGPNQSTLTEPEIHEILSARLQHNLIKDLSTAKKLRNELQNAGVAVSDKRREWRADGVLFAVDTPAHRYIQSESSGSTEDADEIRALIDERAQAKAEGRSEKANEIRVALFRQYNVNINDKTLEWSVGSGALGPNGHNYKLAADAGPNQSTLSEAEIHQMLSRRLQHNLIKDLETASRIRKDLWKAGVKVIDKRREWRADGAVFAAKSTPHRYAQSELSKSTADTNEIQALVDARTQAKAEGQSKKANELRKALFLQFQVSVNDKTLEWSLGGTCFGPNGHNYKVAEDAGPNKSMMPEPEIHEKLSSLLQHKLIKDYRTASKLRDDLQKAGVEVNDETREWRADGASFNKEVVVQAYVQSEFSTSTDDVEEIQALVDERAKVMAEGLWKKADEMREVLFRRFHVVINDERFEWSVGGGCYGPQGHDYKLAEDAKLNRSTLSEAEIHQMLSARLQYWLVREYRTVRKIGGDLRNAGVEVNDNTREWRADGACFAPTYVRSNSSGSTENEDEIQALVDERARARVKKNSRKASEIRCILFQQFQVCINDKKLEWSVGGSCYGPKGHDYRLATDAGPNQSNLSEPEIHQMLSTRRQHWWVRDYRTANKIGEVLRKAGVEVNDDTREWRADGACFDGLDAPKYTRSKYSTPTAADDEIQALVDERSQAKAQRRYEKVDEIRVDLLRRFQVYINDKSLEWSVGSGCFGPNGHDYTLAEDAGPNQSSLSEPEIHEKLSTHLQHKLIKDYRTASKLRDDLRNAGVEVNDDTREWRADGDSFAVELVVQAYVQSEFSTSTDDADEIQALVDERAKAMAEGLWEKTDEIRKDLFHRFHVTVNDKQFEWSVGGTCLGPNGHYYKLAAGAGSNRSTLSESEIHQMLSNRLQLWLIKNHSEANFVLKKLREAGVEVNDKAREWRADGASFNFVARTYVQSELSASTKGADVIQT